MLTITKHLLSVKFFQGTPTSRSRWVGHLKSRFRAEKDLTDLQQIFLELTDNKSSCSNQPVMLLSDREEAERDKGGQARDEERQSRLQAKQDRGKTKNLRDKEKESGKAPRTID